MPVYLDIALALITVFLLLSLATTTVTELIATLFKTRARHLSRALEGMLQDKTVRENFYSHPLVTTIRPKRMEKDPKRWGHPSYLPSMNFAKALHQAVIDAQDHDPQSPAQETLAGFRQTASKIQDEDMRRAVLSLTNDAANSIDEVKEAFATWFDSSMEHLSGQFKRRQQAVSFATALCLAAGLNIDAIGLSKDVAEDDALRMALTEFSFEISQSQELEDYLADPGTDTQPVEPDIATQSAEQEISEQETNPKGNEPASKPPLNSFQKLKDLGIGHDEPNIVKALLNAEFGQMFGWVMAALAAMLGAPFWFDLLQRFVQIRGAGVKPDALDKPQTPSTKGTSS
ncbi:MAG: hypothetical protein AAGD04_10555 [Pseudomonadota bacterium]